MFLFAVLELHKMHLYSNALYTILILQITSYYVKYEGLNLYLLFTLLKFELFNFLTQSINFYYRKEIVSLRDIEKLHKKPKHDKEARLAIIQVCSLLLYFSIFLAFKNTQMI